MKAILIALALCIPIILVVATVFFPPVRVLTVIPLLELFQPDPPSILDGIRCKVEGNCPRQSAMFAARLRQQFPAGTSLHTMNDVLMRNKFRNAGEGAWSFEWITIPCMNEALVEAVLDDQQRIAKINGYYVLTCH